MSRKQGRSTEHPWAAQLKLKRLPRPASASCAQAAADRPPTRGGQDLCKRPHRRGVPPRDVAGPLVARRRAGGHKQLAVDGARALQQLPVHGARGHVERACNQRRATKGGCGYQPHGAPTASDGVPGGPTGIRAAVRWRRNPSPPGSPPGPLTGVHNELHAARRVQHGQLREADVIADAYAQAPHLQAESGDAGGLD